MSTFKAAIQSGLEEYLQALTRAIEGLTPTEIQLASHPTHQSYCLVGLAHGTRRGRLGQPVAAGSPGVAGRRLGGPLPHGPYGEWRSRANDGRGPGDARDPLA